MGTRALTGFKKDGKYYMVPRKLDGGYFVAGAEILKCYINNTRDDFEKVFNMIDFKDEPKYGNSKEDAIREGLFYRRYDLSSENLIALINTKDIEVASRKTSPHIKYNMPMLEEEILVYNIKGIPQIIPYNDVKHLDIEDEQVEGKLSFVNFDIFGENNYASYMYIYNFDSDSLECYNLKWYDKYENKDNKKEIHLKDRSAAFRFVNTFTFTRDLRLRKYLELFESWCYIEKAFDVLEEDKDDSCIEEIVEARIDDYLDVVSKINEKLR